MYGLQLLLTLILVVIVIWNIILISQPFGRKKLGTKVFPSGARAGKGIKQIRSTSSLQYKIGQVFLYFYTPLSIYTILFMIIHPYSSQLLLFGALMIIISFATFTMFSNILEVRENGYIINGINFSTSDLKSWTWTGSEGNKLRIYREKPIWKVFPHLTTTELPNELKEDLEEWFEKKRK